MLWRIAALLRRYNVLWKFCTPPAVKVPLKILNCSRFIPDGNSAQDEYSEIIAARKYRCMQGLGWGVPARQGFLLHSHGKAGIVLCAEPEFIVRKRVPVNSRESYHTHSCQGHQVNTIDHRRCGAVIHFYPRYCGSESIMLCGAIFLPVWENCWWWNSCSIIAAAFLQEPSVKRTAIKMGDKIVLENFMCWCLRCSNKFPALKSAFFKRGQYQVCSTQCCFKSSKFKTWNSSKFYSDCSMYGCLLLSFTETTRKRNIYSCFSAGKSCQHKAGRLRCWKMGSENNWIVDTTEDAAVYIQNSGHMPGCFLNTTGDFERWTAGCFWKIYSVGKGLCWYSCRHGYGVRLALVLPNWWEPVLPVIPNSKTPRCW